LKAVFVFQLGATKAVSLRACIAKVRWEVVK
jgi:hypothetical protein